MHDDTVQDSALTSMLRQFGESVALYFAFLDSYTRALVIPAVLGLSFYFFGTPYSPLYSSLLVLWSIGFVEWWRVRERLISVRFGTQGYFKVEKLRVSVDTRNKPRWWQRELRMLSSVPVIFGFAIILGILMTAIFVFEAFVTQLYTGPGQKIAVRLTVLVHLDASKYNISVFFPHSSLCCPDPTRCRHLPSLCTMVN